jgi:hypothetical protein
MSVGGRAQERRRLLRRGALIAGLLVLLALVFLLSGHWVLGVLIGAVAVLAILVLLQVRTVR